jgi:hypothetical protein
MVVADGGLEWKEPLKGGFGLRRLRSLELQTDMHYTAFEYIESNLIISMKLLVLAVLLVTLRAQVT